MLFNPPLSPAVFLSRENRYLAWVDAGAGVEGAHVPNSGKMAELLAAGRACRIAPASHPRRKTAWDLTLIEHEGRWVSVDARLPPVLVQEALASGVLGLPGFPHDLRREVRHGASRFDLAGRAPDGVPCFIEAKSVNLVAGRTALFPDVPTARGARHCRHLAELAGAGCRGAIVFVVQREDADALAPHREVDPEFAAALAEARAAGVVVAAVRCRVTAEEITPAGEIGVMRQPCG